MHANAELRLWMAHERLARARLQAATARLADEARQRHRLSLRQRTGRAMIAAGRRLAAEPARAPKGLSAWHS